MTSFGATTRGREPALRSRRERACAPGENEAAFHSDVPALRLERAARRSRSRAVRLRQIHAAGVPRAPDPSGGGADASL